MRAIHSFTVLLPACSVFAQIQDPGFEQLGLQWDHWCEWQFVNDVPPGGGNWSLRMPVVSGISPDCYVIDDLQPLAYQELPWVQSGDELLISSWRKATPDDPNDAPNMDAVCVIGWLTSPTTFDYDYAAQPTTWEPVPGDWEELTIARSVGQIPVGSTPVLFIGGHGFVQSPGFIQFDNVSVVTTTGIADHGSVLSTHGIDATSGDLWIQLPAAPLTVIVLDAQGRTMAVAWQHTGSRVELSTGELAGGAYSVIVRTASGDHAIRFVRIR